MIFKRAFYINLILSAFYGKINCQSEKYHYKWDNKRPITWYYQNQQYPRFGDEYLNITNCIRVAMSVWQHNANIVLQEEHNDSADILIDFYRNVHGDNTNFDGKGGVVAHAFPPRSSGIGGDVHLDQDEDWDFSCDKKDKRSHKISFLYTFLHELGHSLGLIYHLNDHNSVMIAYYPFKLSIENNINFFEVDVNEIAKIYGKKVSQTLIPRREMTQTLTTAITTSTSRHPITIQSTNPTTTNPPVEEDEVRPACGAASDNNKLCEVSYDTVALFRGETWIFKGSNMWRIDSYGALFIPISFMFQGMENVTKIDALFIDHAELTIHFFTGREAYTFSISTGLKLTRKQNFKQLKYDDKVSRIKGVIQYNSSIYAIFDTKAQIIDTNLRAFSRPFQDLKDNKLQNFINIDFKTLAQEFNEIYLLNGDNFYEMNATTMALKVDKTMSVHQKFGKCQNWMTKSEALSLSQNLIITAVTIVLSINNSL